MGRAIRRARRSRPTVFLLADSKKRLAKLNRLTVFSENFGDNSAGFGLNLVHHFHRFDDANDGIFGDGFPDFNKSGRVGRC